MTNNNLLPCPFCGGKVTYLDNGIEGEKAIECTICGAFLLFDVNLTQTQITNHWNTRAPTVEQILDDPDSYLHVYNDPAQLLEDLNQCP